MSLNTLKMITGDLEENCYVVWQEGAKQAVVIDPGWDAGDISSALKDRGLTVGAFLLTHCHGDHIGALGTLKQEFPAAPIHAPSAEKEWLQRPTLNLSFFFGFSIVAPPADVLVNGGDELTLAGIVFKAIHVPGHSPGSTAYYVETPNRRAHLYGGDILFKSGIGRTDLPGGEGEDVLIEGIRSKLFCLPEDTIVFPGHGEETNIGEEKMSNPYCRVDD